jgi:hypothetical protein
MTNAPKSESRDLVPVSRPESPRSIFSPVDGWGGATMFLAKGLLAWFVVFGVVAALSWQHRDAPYYWDSLGYVWPHANEIHSAFPSPFLRNYDVGHPTLFYWLWAASWKLAAWQGMADPQAPIVGHLLTWAFAALAYCAIYGLGRALEEPRPVALGCAAASLALPVVWANAQLVQLDLPMFAFAMAATFFWVRRRPVLYMLAATGAILTKLYGFAPLCGVGAAVFFGSGRWWLKGNRGPFARLLVWTYAPLLALPAFIGARALALDGLHWSIAYPQPTEKAIYVWEGARFLSHLPFAYEIYFRATLTHHLLLALLAIGPIALLLSLLRRSEEPIGAYFAPTPRYNALLALGIMAVGYTLAIFQFGTGLCLPRYVMPISAAITLLLFHAAWVACRKIAWLIAAQAALLLGCWIFWHPSHSEFLPGPLKNWLRRSPAPAGHVLEVDLRFLDATDLATWAAERIAVDAKLTGSTRAVATVWPITVAYHVPAMGWLKEPLFNTTFSDWGALDPSTHPYVLSMRPISGFPDPPADLGAVLVAKEMRGDVEAIVWRVPAKTAGVPAAIESASAAEAPTAPIPSTEPSSVQELVGDSAARGPDTGSPGDEGAAKDAVQREDLPEDGADEPPEEALEAPEVESAPAESAP